MDQLEGLQPGDRIEVLEGSWAGRKGNVVSSVRSNEREIEVDFDDGPRELVVACTVTKMVDEHG